MSDKRTAERTPVAGQVAGEITVFQPMSILDMSEKGAQIETPFALQNDSLREFRLTLGARSVVVRGRIVYCQIGELRDGIVLYRSGIEFVEPSPHATVAIREFVAASRAPRPPVIDAELA